MEVRPYETQPSRYCIPWNNSNSAGSKQLKCGERSRIFVKSNEHWPSQPSNYQEDDSELKTPRVSVTTSTVNATLIPNITEPMDASKYNSIVRLLRVTAYVLRFLNNLKNAYSIWNPR